MWASLETFNRRGEVVVDFSCRLLTPSPAAVTANATRQRQPETARTRNAARTKKWKTSQQKRRNPALIPTSNAPPANAVNVQATNAPAPATSTPVTSAPAAVRTFAEVAAEPASGSKAAATATAGQKRLKAPQANPKKGAKTALAASRVSQRAALLSKKRAAAAAVEVPAVTPTPTAADQEEAAPEVLRETEGETGHNVSFNISLVASPPPQQVSPPSLPPPSPPPPKLKNCDCSISCEEDFHDEMWEDGVRLNTLKPGWDRVFPRFRSLRRCRFCKEPLAERGDDGDDEGSDSEGECPDCHKLSTFTLVKKFAPRWRYPKN